MGRCRKRYAGSLGPQYWESAGLEWRRAGRGPREPLVGFEPTTARLRIESSTPELQWRDVGCPGADSNRDAFRHYPLKIACLPVSPPGRAGEQDSLWQKGGQPGHRLRK